MSTNKKTTVNGITLSNSSWRVLERLSYGDWRRNLEGNKNYILGSNNKRIWKKTVSQSSYKDMLLLRNVGKKAVHILIQELSDIGIQIKDSGNGFVLRQNIVICLDEFGRYTQATKKRFTEYRDASNYASGIATSRYPVIVKVPYVPIDNKGYPKK
jgi:hypothetical protein